MIDSEGSPCRRSRLAMDEGGYARQGATTIPVVALLACVGIAAAWRRAPLRLRDALPATWRLRLLIGLAALLLVIESARTVTGPQVTIDGRTIGDDPPFPIHDHRDRRVELD